MEGAGMNPVSVHASVFSSSKMDVASASIPESVEVSRASELVREPETIRGSAEGESVAIDNLVKKKNGLYFVLVFR
jgi:hypothetical protein